MHGKVGTSKQFFAMLTDDGAKLLAQSRYGIDVASVSPLTSYDDQNFLITASDAEQFVLKISNDGEDFDSLRLQNALMNFLVEKTPSFGLAVPRVVSSLSGEEISTHADPDTGRPHYIRLVTFIKGVPMCDVSPVPDAMLADLGRVLAGVANTFSTFDTHDSGIANALSRGESWDVRQFSETRSFLGYLQNEKQKRIIIHFFDRFDTVIGPRAKELRLSPTHNDANDANLIVDPSHNTVTGLIDFGDAIKTYVVNELAIACAYAMLPSDQPIHTAVTLVTTFHEVFPLTQAEQDCLCVLVCCRWCVSVLHSARKRATQNSSEHAFVSEKPAWKILELVHDPDEFQTFEKAIQRVFETSRGDMKQ